jgi:hypothetical protein
MKKFSIIAVILLFVIGATSAMAAELTLSGSYFGRGTYNQNLTGDSGDPESFRYYDQEFDLNAVLQIDDSTKIVSRFEMGDMDWGRTPANSGEATIGRVLPYIEKDIVDKNDKEVDVVTDVTYYETQQPDDNIYLEYIYGSHTFANGGNLEIGKMSSGAWATAFGNTEVPAWRIKYLQPTSVGMLVAIAQKDTEAGNKNKGNDYDQDTYYLGMITKSGNVKIEPIVVYQKYADDAYCSNLMALIVAASGTFNQFSFESELQYNNFDARENRDFETYGLYAKGSYTNGPATFSLLGAYGSVEENAVDVKKVNDDGTTTTIPMNVGFSFGDDFNAGGALIIGDDLFIDSNGALNGAYLFAATASYKVNDRLTLNGYLGHAGSNYPDAKWDGAYVTELDFTGEYLITPNITYSAGAGVAKMQYGDDTPNPDNSIELFNKIEFRF